MTNLPTPLDFDDLRRRRQQAVEAATQRAIDLRKRIQFERPPLVLPPPDLDPLAGMPEAPAGAMVAPQDEPFGTGVLKGVGAAARFLNQPTPLDRFLPKPTVGSPEESRGSLNPVRAVTGLMGTSGRVFARVGTGLTAVVQKAIPGRQEIERLVDEGIASGMSYIDSLDTALTGASREGGVSVPFFRTALTPKGSITVDWEDVAAAGLDPIDLALLVGTGGAASGVKKAAKVVQAAAHPIDALGQVATRGLTIGTQPAKRVVARPPVLDLFEQQIFGKTAEKVGRFLRPDGSRDPALAKRILGGAVNIVDPTAAAGDHAGRRATILYEAYGALGANAVSASKDWILAAGNPRSVFNLSRQQLARVSGISLTPKGQQIFKARGLPTEGPFAFGDLAEYWIKSEAPDVSLFTGLNATQAEVLERVRRVFREYAELAEAEGVLKVAKGQTVGQKFADVFGEPGENFFWVHRGAAGKTIINERGEVEELLFNSGRPGRGGKPFTQTRTYELKAEGVRDGINYLDPMESIEALGSAVYRTIAQKRALDYMKRQGKLVTGLDVMERLYPQMIARRKAAAAFLAATEANVGRIKRKLANRRAKAPLLDEAADTAEAEVIRNSKVHTRTINRMQVEMFQAMKFLEQSKTAANDGLRRRARNLYQQRLGRMQVTEDEVERIFTEHQRLYRRTVAANRRIVKLDGDIFGLTSNRAQAEAQEALARLTKMRVDREYAETMSRIMSSADLDSRVFGGRPGTRTPVSVYSDGPLAGQIAPRNLADALQQRFGDRGNRAVGAIEQVTGSARTLAAGSFDVGWLGIQGSLLAVTHPDAYAKAAVQSIRAALNPERRAKYIAENIDAVLSFIENTGDIGSSEFFASLGRGGLFGRLGSYLQRKAPEGSGFDRGLQIWRNVNPVPRLGTGFNVFLDVGKIELWKSLRGPLTAGGMLDREIATHINNMMGTMNSRFLGVSPTQRQIEGALLMFSPRYTRSAFALMAELARPLGTGATLNGLATREAMRAIGGFVAGGTLVTWAIAQATGSDVQLNPFKPGWLTLTIGGQKVGIGGSTRALLDTMAKMAATVASVDDRQPLDLARFNLFDSRHRAENPILQYVSGRTPPGIREILTRETFDGQKLEGPVDLAKEIGQDFLPFALQAQFFPPPGVDRQSPVALLPEVTGLRARQLSAYERLRAEQDRVAQEAAGVPWAELDNDRKAVLRRDNPNLGELQEATAAASRDTPKSHYFDRRLKDRQEHLDRLSPAAAEFQATGNGRTFRQKYDEEAAIYREQLRRTDREFADVVRELDEERGDQSQTAFNRLVDRYGAQVRDNPEFVDEFGNPLWDEINQAERAFEREVGAEMFQRVRRYFLGLDDEGQPLHDDVPAAVYELRRAREVLREADYWRIADDIVGDDPEARAIWRQYENSDKPAEREAIKRRFPRIRQVERIVDRNRDRIRRRSPGVDMALMIFYGTRAASREGRQFERQLQRQTRAQAVPA